VLVDAVSAISFNEFARAPRFVPAAAGSTPQNQNDLPKEAVARRDIAGAGLIHKPATVDPPKLRAFAHRIEESRPLA